VVVLVFIYLICKIYKIVELSLQFLDGRPC